MFRLELILEIRAKINQLSLQDRYTALEIFRSHIEDTQCVEIRGGVQIILRKVATETLAEVHRYIKSRLEQSGPEI